LDELLLRLTESSSVRDVEDTIVGLGVLSVDTSDLHFVLISDLVEEFLVFLELGQSDVDRCSHRSSKVRGARGDVTEMVITGEFCDCLNVRGSSAESLENGSDICSLLHSDDSELILFVDPDKEGLGVVVEDSSSRWPVPVESA